jgi:hypothetical protein
VPACQRASVPACKRAAAAPAATPAAPAAPAALVQQLSAPRADQSPTGRTDPPSLTEHTPLRDPLSRHHHRTSERAACTSELSDQTRSQGLRGSLWCQPDTTHNATNIKQRNESLSTDSQAFAPRQAFDAIVQRVDERETAARYCRSTQRVQARAVACRGSTHRSRRGSCR